MELPVQGYPEGAEAVRAWFRHRYGREPSGEEMGSILNAMALRETSPPADPAAMASSKGWHMWQKPASDRER